VCGWGWGRGGGRHDPNHFQKLGGTVRETSDVFTRQPLNTSISQRAYAPPARAAARYQSAAPLTTPPWVGDAARPSSSSHGAGG
jgi:hypothetical protein